MEIDDFLACNQVRPSAQQFCQIQYGRRQNDAVLMVSGNGLREIKSAGPCSPMPLFGRQCAQVIVGASNICRGLVRNQEHWIELCWVIQQCQTYFPKSCPAIAYASHHRMAQWSTLWPLMITITLEWSTIRPQAKCVLKFFGDDSRWMNEQETGKMKNIIISQPTNEL